MFGSEHWYASVFGADIVRCRHLFCNETGGDSKSRVYSGQAGTPFGQAWSLVNHHARPRDADFMQ